MSDTIKECTNCKQKLVFTDRTYAVQCSCGTVNPCSEEERYRIILQRSEPQNILENSSKVAEGVEPPRDISTIPRCLHCRKFLMDGYTMCEACEYGANSSKPDTKESFVPQFVRGEEVEALDVDGKWYNVIYRGTKEGVFRPYYCLRTAGDDPTRIPGQYYEDIRKLPQVQEAGKVTRIEVISDTRGREYVKRNLTNVEVRMQDDGKTMKIFIEE